MANRNTNVERTIIISQDTSNALKKYAASKHVTVSQAVRELINNGLSIEYAKESQTEIRNYIREEVEEILPRIIQPYMERLIKMQANATRTSAASLIAVVDVIAENYTDTATPAQILANAFKQSTAITKTKAKSDAEYLAEARTWLSSNLEQSYD